MSIETNKALVRRWYDAFNKRNFALAYEFIAPNYVNHTLHLRGREDLKQFINRLIKGFPDYHMTIKDIIAEGNKVWFRLTETMTHKGKYRGIAPTGKKIKIKSVWISRIVDGKFVEEWGVSDVLDFYKQLGVIAYTKTGRKHF
jgi:steroid delta-isomerase-like uncharacterized protein